MKDKMKVLYLTNIPAPYRVDFFNELGLKCDLTVLFERQQAKNRHSSWTQYRNEFYKIKQLKGFSLGNDSAISVEIIKYLSENKYDVIVVGGYSTPTAMLAILYMKFKGIPFLLNADGGQVKQDGKVLKVIKTFFICEARGFLSTGKITDEYFMHYGAKKEKIYHYPFTSVKEQDIIPTIKTYEDKKQKKDVLKIKDKKIIISVGQFVRRKGFDILIKAMKHVHNATLYIVGGEPTEEYCDLMQELGLTNVKFFSFMQPKQLLQYYNIADVFVLPTREDIWGLVINEAMSQGLPVVTTDKCVAGLELIRNGRNGFIVPVEDEYQLALKINTIVNNEELRLIMAKNSLDTIKEYSIEKMAERHMEIFHKYLEGLNDESYTN